MLALLVSACQLASDSIGQYNPGTGTTGGQPSADTADALDASSTGVDGSSTAFDSSGGSDSTTTQSGTTVQAGTETGEPMECILEDELDALARMSKGDLIDCGRVDERDPPEQWAALQTCVLESSAQELGFTAVYSYFGIDNQLWEAMVGLQGAVYERRNLWQTSGFFGAGILGPVRASNCSQIVEGSCIGQFFGEICLECVVQGEPQQLCPDE